jgi:hypothetical protein
VTTQRGEDPATAVPEGENWFIHPAPRLPGDDAPSPDPVSAVSAVRAVANGAGAPWSPPGATRAERRRAREAAEGAGGYVPQHGGVDRPDGGAAGYGRPGDVARGGGLLDGTADSGRPEGTNGSGARVEGFADGVEGFAESVEGFADSMVPEQREKRRGRRRATEPSEDAVARRDGFDPGDTGTWRVRDMVPGADGGRRNTTILRYLLGLLAVDHVRALTRWIFVVPVLGLVLLLVRPRWIGLAVLVLGVLLIVTRVVAVKVIVRHTLPRRYRPVEDDLRAAVEAGKANLRGELRRVGMPSSALAIPRSVVRLGSSDSRTRARSLLRDIEIDRVLPRAQLDRALRVLDGPGTGR